jgi:hypothetical protein
MVQRAAVLQEAAQLHGFIGSVIRLCADMREDYPVYSRPSLAYFKYILELGEKTQVYLEAFPAEYFKSTDERIASSRLQKLYSLKTSWEMLHEYIKPALDADTLHVPSSLITAFADIVNSVDGWEEFRFVLFHTTEANYLQIPAKMARQVADEIASSVKCAPFDANVGLVGIPYSQPDSISLNCVLPHEFAHFIYQEVSSYDVSEQIDKSTAGLNHLDSEDLSLCVDEITLWVEETFCDLMAICMIGPAFSIALVRLTGATALVGRPDGAPDEAYLFKLGYPADVARLHFHKLLLDRLGWWPLVREWDCSAITAIKKCSDWSQFLTVEGAMPLPDESIAAYLEICEWLIGYCSDYFPKISDTVKTFAAQSPEIDKYLERAIVPSTVVVDGVELYPDPIVLLNSGVKFLSQDLGRLISNISGKDAYSVADNASIGARVELWILKAIEDSRLLARQKAQ